MILIAIFLFALFLYALVSARLERTILTAPIVFATAGMLAAVSAPHLGAKGIDPGLLLQVAEIGLVLLLFSDSSRTDLALLKSIRALPMRLLSWGMLLTILFGGLAALVVFRQLSLWEAGILAAILAPTDAGLGQVIVKSPRVPVEIREALSVEAGLNDGLAVPFLLFFIALAAGAPAGDEASLHRFVVQQLGFGAAIGVGIGLGGGWLMGRATRAGSVSREFLQLGLVALPLLCALTSDFAQASMFIAAFVAGLAVQVGFHDVRGHSLEFAEGWGQLLNLLVFFLFGVLAAGAWGDLRPAHLLYAVLSLTAIRMVPVAIALLGTRLGWRTVLFLGWFGPRGLASIVLGLVFLEHGSHTPGQGTIRLAVVATVLLSTFGHGLTARPGTALFGK